MLPERHTMNDADTTQTDTDDEQSPIYVYWRQCSECGYETAAHGRVKCPGCNRFMTSIALAGAVVDGRGDSSE